jgi:hypothetical protein
MELVKTQFDQLLLDKDRLSTFQGDSANEFLGFIQKFIADINFKISVAAIQICS